MALLAPTEGVTHDPEGNALSGMVPGEDAFAVPRLLFRDHGQFGDAYVLHDFSADPVLDRVYQSRAMIHILASGVFFSGFIKDLLCLPRPLSPPLQRITMSGSAALEYGFPSTHSTNAVSVAVYALYLLNLPGNTVGPTINTTLQGLLYVYVTSIVLGRLYCGMHGILDVIVGCVLGAVLALVQCKYGQMYDEYLVAASGQEVLVVVLVVLALVRIHPEPADDCPCFDDSVAFAGVFVGCEAAHWHFARTSFAWSDPCPATVPYRLSSVGWWRTFARIAIGVVTIFTWREIMKPLLLRILPPIFRGLERAGLLLPRKFFTKASEYQTVPDYLKYDDVLPNVSDFPSILTSIRHPRRRAISIGPQSEADAYETLAYREKRRRESLSERPNVDTMSLGTEPMKGHHQSRLDEWRPLTEQTPSKLDAYEYMMGTTPDAATSTRSNPMLSSSVPERDYGSDGLDEMEMFSRITQPRVRYDVEVVTKLIVYSGAVYPE
ncbi:PAP2 superfamily domain containing protein [Elaphomyces granulatus]